MKYFYKNKKKFFKHDFMFKTINRKHRTNTKRYFQKRKYFNNRQLTNKSEKKGIKYLNWKMNLK